MVLILYKKESLSPRWRNSHSSAATEQGLDFGASLHQTESRSIPSPIATIVRLNQTVDLEIDICM